MRSIIAGLVAAFALVAAPGAFADSTWTRISRDGLAGTYTPQLTADGARVVAGWRFSDPDNPSTGTDGLEVQSFVPSETADALDPQGPVNVTPAAQSTGAWSFVGGTGAVGVVFGAVFADGGGYTHLSARNPDGSFAAPQRLTDSAIVWADPSGALALPDPAATPTVADDTLLFASGSTGGVYMGRATAAAPASSVGAPNLQAPLGGGGAYEPRIGQTTSGQVWVAWYSSATNATGLFMQQVDAATGAGIGSPAKAPQSESVGNNAPPALACQDVCRIVYRIDALALGTRLNRIVSWSPGEGAPTFVANQDDVSGGFEAAAAYRADGRLWIAWHQDGNQALSGSGYRATLGDARGAGAVVQDIGAPPQLLTSYSLRGLAVGNDLVLAANVARTEISRGAAVWVNVIAPPASVADVPDTLDVREEGGKLKIRVQYRLRDTCASPCTARAEIRVRTGKRLKAGAEPLPGDSTILGTAKGIALTGSGRERFDIVVSKAKLRKAKGKVVGPNTFIETRLRVRLRQPDGTEVVTFRDGRIRVAVARLA